MNTLQYILAYHFDNHLVAAEIDQKLSRAGFQFDHIHTGNAIVNQSIATRLQAGSKPFILLLTDNFLKDEMCLHKLLETIQAAQKESRDFILLLASGFTIDPVTNQLKSIEIKLSSVGDILFYINYWQDKYLQLRKNYLDNDKSMQVVDYKLKVLREIAAEIGELLHKLRKLEPVSFSDFTKDNFRYFFEHSGYISQHEAYKQMSEYDEKDALIEQKVNRILEERTESPDSSPETQVEELVEVSDENEYAGKQNDAVVNPGNKANINEDKKLETDSELLQRLKAYKNGILQEESEQKLNKQTSSETKPEEKEEIFRTKEEYDEILKLEEEVSKSLGIRGSGQETHLKDAKDTEDDDDDWDDEPAETSSQKENTREFLFYEAVRLDPDNIENRLQLIRFLMEDPEKFSETADQLEQLLKRDKNNTEAIYLLSILSVSIKEYQMARTYLEKLVQVQPDYPDAYYKLALLIEEHFKGDEEEAANYFKKAFQHDTHNITALEKRAYLLHKILKKHKKAYKAYKAIVKSNPHHPTAYYHLAELANQLNDKEKAIKYYNKAKEITGRTRISSEQESQEEDLRIQPEPKYQTDMVSAEHILIPDLVKKEVSSYICITGASSGIGRALSHLLASKGYNLLLMARRADLLLDLSNELRSKYDIGIETIPFDIRNFDQTSLALGELGDTIDKIDVLINNAGLALGLDYINEANIAHWETMIDTNIKGLLYMTRLVSPSMVKRKSGHIINIGSTAGKEVYPKGNVYCATKFAVDALTKAFRQDLYQHNIRVSQVSPGHTENTEFAITRFEGDEEKAGIYNDFNPLKAQDIAEIIYFIITQPPHVNIQDVLVMGTQQASSTLINRSGRIFDNM